MKKEFSITVDPNCKVRVEKDDRPRARGYLLIFNSTGHRFETPSLGYSLEIQCTKEQLEQLREALGGLE